MIQRKQSGIGKELEMLIVVVLGYRRMKLLWIMKMSVSVWWERISGRNRANIFKKNPSQIVASAPCFGEHNREVLKDFGYTDEEIDALYKKGELATWTPADTARIKNFVEWHFFWDPERQAKRIGLEYPPKK